MRGLLHVTAGWMLLSTAYAAPAPNLPLPPCVDDEGLQTGACPRESPDVAGTAVGRLSFNSSTGAYVEPQIPACNTWDANGTGNWSPSPCYNEVDAIEVVGCAYIPVGSGGFREESSCARVLFAPGTTATGNLFQIGNGPGGTCGGAAAFDVYYYGGPATQPDRIWAALGPNSTKCEVQYLGPRPDGLFGPTWVKLRATIYRMEGSTGYDTGSARTTEFYLPIDGELRDLGPVAAFRDSFNAGGTVRFANDSFHTQGESMTYRWDFGDGKTASGQTPEHRYEEPGVYRVTLTARDQTGDEAKATVAITVEFTLGVDIAFDPPSPKVEEPFTVTVAVTNAFDEAVSRFALIGPDGLRLDPEHLVQIAGPDPEVPATLAPGETITFTFEVEPIAAGTTIMEGGAQAWLGSANVSKTKTVSVYVPARLDVELTTSVKSSTKVGDEFTATATVTNSDTVTIENIKSEPLETRPLDIVDHVSGPTTVDGADPRVSPLSLEPGQSTTLTWTYVATGKGPVDLRALVSARDPHSDTLLYASGKKRIAIESGGIEVTDVRLSPGSPSPGSFGLIRGVISNIGTLDVVDIDFTLDGNPDVRQVERELRQQDESVSPRIALLEPEESREFQIPYGISTMADGVTKYRVEVTMTGSVELEGQLTEVSHSEFADGGLDLNNYWTSFFNELMRTYWDDTLSLVEGINEWGETSTIGGSVVGGGQGVLDAFQTAGDGLISTGELVVNTVTGKYELTKKGQQLAEAAVEYFHTRSLKGMAVDLADAEIAATNALAEGICDPLGRWLQKVDVAVSKGDSREVARLLTESGTTVALTVGGEMAVERVGAKLLGFLIKKPVARETLGALRAESGPVERGIEIPDAELRKLEVDDIRDLPTGVSLPTSTVLKAGINQREHSWMQRMAKEHGVAFFVRPRPAAAAEFAAKGWNAKPMAIKFKSVNDIDIKWLGWDDYAGKDGLVCLREPKDPWPAILEAMERDEIKWGSQEVDAIVARYNKRKAEWKSVEQKLFDLNAENGGEGFEVLHKGKVIKTKAYLDPDGLMRFSHNNQPVYSDIDLLHIGYPDGRPIDKALYDKLVEAGGEGFDMQHGATFNTGDFKDWAQAQGFVNEYAGEHMRITPSGARGDPLIIVQPDVTTAGYVKNVEMPAEAAGSGGDLYGLVNATFEGAGHP